MSASEVGERLVAAGVAATFDHVAHAAPRILDLLPLYRDLLGGVFHAGGANPRVGYRAVQLVFAGGGKIELLEPIDGSTFLDSFFRRNPAGGLHHVTFRVPDIRAAVPAAEALGFDVIGVYYGDPRWQEAFLHPRSAHGVLLQMVEAEPGFPGPRPGSTLESVLLETEASGPV